MFILLIHSKGYSIPLHLEEETQYDKIKEIIAKYVDTSVDKVVIRSNGKKTRDTDTAFSSGQLEVTIQ